MSRRINYSIGYQIGGDFKRQGWQLQPEILIQGIRDAVHGTLLWNRQVRL